jgi:uncharacterized membrane protein YuzA (DUF378 family)
MNPSPPPPSGFDLDAVLSWILLIGLSLWGGVASFVRKMKDGHVRAWNFTELVGELVIAGFTGVLVANLCDSLPANMACPASLKYALVGIAAHMGSRALFKLETVLNSKFNLPADAPAQTGDDHVA